MEISGQGPCRLKPSFRAIMDMIIHDFDSDSIPDILASGNFIL